jgi:hypothetical protein
MKQLEITKRSKKTKKALERSGILRQQLALLEVQQIRIVDSLEPTRFPTAECAISIVSSLATSTKKT